MVRSELEMAIGRPWRDCGRKVSGDNQIRIIVQVFTTPSSFKTDN